MLELNGQALWNNFKRRKCSANYKKFMVIILVTPVESLRFCSWLLDDHGLELLAPLLVMVDKSISLTDVAAGIKDHGRNSVWADVGCWSSVFDVTLTIVMHNLGWDSERARSVSSAVRELVNRGGLMDSSKPLVVVGTVKLDVESVLLLEEDHHVVYVLHFPGTSSHGFGREVGVATGSVPVGEELWLKGDGDIEFLRASVEEVSGQGHMVTLLNTGAWTDLELPLSWHDLSIGSRNFDSGIEAALVMSIVESSTEGDIASD